MNRLLWLSAGVVVGFLGCFVVVSWRIQAADAYAKLYAVGAMNAVAERDSCRQQIPAWPRRR